MAALVSCTGGGQADRWLAGWATRWPLRRRRRAEIRREGPIGGVALSLPVAGFEESTPMAALSVPLFALVPPPLTVALSDGMELASMALLAVVLAAASIAVRRLRRPGHPGDGGPGTRRRTALGATRARS
jgi:hypothetical protein